MRDAWTLTAADLTAAYATGAATPEGALESVLSRIEAVNPGLNAVVTIDLAGARAGAAAAGARWRSGQALGSLDGIPLTVKDNLFVGRLRATWGSALFADFIAPQDDLPVARLRAAGAVIVGKTNTPELSLSGYTDNLVFGSTGNPWAPALSPGGSSGGAVAAVASGMAPLALATDAGGAIRRPGGPAGGTRGEARPGPGPPAGSAPRHWRMICKSLAPSPGPWPIFVPCSRSWPPRVSRRRARLALYGSAALQPSVMPPSSRPSQRHSWPPALSCAPKVMRSRRSRRYGIRTRSTHCSAC